MSIPVVTSQQNPVFRELLLALAGDSPLGLAHGATIVRDMSRSLQPRTLIVRESFNLLASPTVSELMTRRFQNPVTRLTFSDALFDELDPFGVPDLIAAFQKPVLPAWDAESATELPQLLLATQNPLNAGACLRSALAFGVKQTVFLKESASAYNAKTIRSSMGAVFGLNILRGPSIHDLGSLFNDSAMSDRAIALDLHGDPLKTFSFPTSPIFLLGEEGLGVPQALCCRRVHIPMAEGIDSLNASVSCGILLYEWASRKTGIN